MYPIGARMLQTNLVYELRDQNEEHSTKNSDQNVSKIKNYNMIVLNCS